MNDLSELFWSCTVEEMKQGYVFDPNEQAYVCLICGSAFEKGRIYNAGDAFYEAEKMASLHLTVEHGSMFDYLIGLNKKWTGLTDLQKNLLAFFHQGLSDQDIVKELDGGSTSTIRNHRFTLREREKQAKVFLAIMGLIEPKTQKKNKFIPMHRTATMLDERYAITEQENDDIIRTYFKEGPDGPITEFPKKEKRKLAILKHIVKRFSRGRKYTEKEVNAVLKTVFHDFVTLRRYLIEYGFMDRLDDGSEYWIKT